ncbi:MAG: hypothetical protein HY803_07125, partial [candidate division NC10 bacterium]|nr:hypothetical protein [candidate division NC10 bacterium]
MLGSAFAGVAPAERAAAFGLLTGWVDRLRLASADRAAQTTETWVRADRLEAALIELGRTRDWVLRALEAQVDSLFTAAALDPAGGQFARPPDVPEGLYLGALLATYRLLPAE